MVKIEEQYSETKFSNEVKKFGFLLVNYPSVVIMNHEEVWEEAGLPEQVDVRASTCQAVGS